VARTRRHLIEIIVCCGLQMPLPDSLLSRYASAAATADPLPNSLKHDRAVDNVNAPNRMFYCSGRHTEAEPTSRFFSTVWKRAPRRSTLRLEYGEAILGRLKIDGVVCCLADRDDAMLLMPHSVRDASSAAAIAASDACFRNQRNFCTAHRQHRAVCVDPATELTDHLDRPSQPVAVSRIELH